MSRGYKIICNNFYNIRNLFLLYYYHMSFDLRARSVDMLSPVHVFPGDETIDSELYTTVIFSGYLSSVSTLTGGAIGHNLNVDTETFERWKRVCGAAGLLDDFLDESNDYQSAGSLYLRVLGGAFDSNTTIQVPRQTDERLAPAVQLLFNSVSVLPEIRKRRLVDSALSIGHAALKKSGCDDIEDYISILKAEAFHTSLLITETASEKVKEQTNYGAFTGWCTNALEAATLLDAARDLWADKMHGRVRVEPTIFRSLIIAKRACHAARKLYKPLVNRQATISGLAARSRFSILPTKLAMRRYIP